MEFGSLALRNADISRQRAELSGRYRALLAQLLAEKAEAGVVALSRRRGRAGRGGADRARAGAGRGGAGRPGVGPRARAAGRGARGPRAAGRLARSILHLSRHREHLDPVVRA